VTRFRIAYFEPVRGLNVYGCELLPHLAALDEVDVYTDGDTSELKETITDSFSVRPFDAFPETNGYDQVLFQLRNNPHHVPVYEALVRHNGLTVFHETKITGIIGAKTLCRGRRLAFLSEVLINEGPGATLRGAFDIFWRRDFERVARHEMNRQAVCCSQGVIVHNHDAEQRLRSRYPGLPICVVRRGVPPARAFDTATTKAVLGLADRFPIVGSFGVINDRKRIRQALEAFAGIVDRFPSAAYVLVGQPYEFDVNAIVERFGLSVRVVVPGRVSEEDFQRYLAVVDIGINLRYPLEGETSSTALRIMSYGKPMLVTDAGSLAELPAGCTIPIKADSREVAEIRDALVRLSRSESLRREIGSAARAYVSEHRTWEQAARGYHRFIHQLSR